jgi:hypothetical protein
MPAFNARGSKVDALKWASSKLLLRVYGDNPQDEAASGELKIRWIERTIVDTNVAPPEPPRQTCSERLEGA